jgi:hypothetical protein
MAPVAVVAGVVVGLFGAIVLFYGIGGVYWLFRDRRRADGEDVFEVALINLIGAVCAFFAWRWVRFAIRDSGAAGRDGGG